MWSCGGDSCVLCHRVLFVGGVREQFGVTSEEALDEISLIREMTEEKVVEMWRWKRREIDRQVHGPAHQ